MSYNSNSSANASANTDSRSATIDVDETQELSSDEQRRLAGLPESVGADNDLLSKEHLYTQADPDKRDIADSAIFRTIFVLLLVGTVVIAFFLMFSGFGGSGKKKSTQPVEPESKAEVATESDQYRAKLALVEQEDGQQQTQAEQQADQTESAQLEQAPVTDLQSQSTKSDRQERSQRTEQAESPPPRRTRTPQAQQAAPRRPVQSEPKPTPTIDPHQRWQLLASAGTQRSDSANASAATSSSAATQNQAVSQSQETLQQTPVQPAVATNPQASGSIGRIGRVTIGASEPVAISNNKVLQPQTQPQTASTTNSSISPSLSPSNSESKINNPVMSPGARGILSRQSLQPVVKGQATPPVKQIVPLGSSAKAEISVPIIWAEDGSSPTAGRFAVTLTEPLLAVNGDIALPKGTVLVTEVQEITPDTHVVYQSAVAVVYRDRSGNLQQQEIAPHNLIVRGRDNQHLIAKSQGGSSGGSLEQDLLVGAMSGLGNIGEVINRPTEEIVREDDSFDSYRRSRRTTSGEADILGAALEGFFERTAERVSDRSTQRTERQAARKDLLLVPTGEQVTVYVNAFLEVQR